MNNKIVRIIRSEEVYNSIVSPTGEKIYEMVGITAPIKSCEISLARVVLDSGISSPKHRNKSTETYEMTKGCAEITINNKSQSLVPGDFCIIESGAIHQIKNTLSQPVEFYVFSTPAWRPEDQEEID